MTTLNEIRLFFEIVGAITIVVGIVNLFISIFSWGLGVFPLFWRLGFGRWSRKIDIAADNANFNSLKSDLLETGIFREKNMRQVCNTCISKAKNSGLLLVHYQSFSADQIKTLLSCKKPNAGYIFYFPEFNPATNKIPDDIRDLINNEQFTTVVNFRGRLINDIMTTLLSTSYDKR